MRRQIRLKRSPRATSALRVLLGLGVLVAAGAAGFTAGGTYVVKPGDTLWAISRANGISVSKLSAANHMRPTDLLLIGRKISIPGSVDPPAAGAQAAAASSKTTSDPPAANPWTFCSTFQATKGPWGVLPSQLRGSSKRLALQPLFIKWASHYNLSLALLEGIAWQESGWQQGVISPVGAIGAGQIMPGTASFIVSNIIGTPMNINSVTDNIRMSAAFLGYLSDLEGNNLCATIAAYYEGPLNLAHYGVFPETQQYVASVEALIPRFE